MLSPFNFLPYKGPSLFLSLTVCPDMAGAKEAHTVSPHFAQIMYFGLVSALAVAPLHCSIGQGVDLFRSFWKRRPISFFQVFITVIAGFFSVHFFRSENRLTYCYRDFVFCLQHPLELDASRGILT
jgi:hypothetical protein